MRKANSIIHCAKRCLPGMLALLACAVAAAQESARRQPPPNMVWRWVGFAGVLVIIWLLFYKGAYPTWVRYYHPDECKSIFWIQVTLFSATWWYLASYTLFDYGFYYIWLRWIGVFLGVLWLIAMFYFAFRPART